MERLSFKVPQKDKQIFLSPSEDKISSLLEENKKIFSQYSFAILNQLFREVREKSRKEVIQRACLLYTSPSPRDRTRSRMPSSA